MASNPNGLKGNPASTRMSNPNRKARRARCWARGEKRKEARRKAQAEREAANKVLWATYLNL
jgi:hypothetical protein